MTRRRVSILPQRIAVCRLEPNAALPAWIRGSFTSVTRTAEELSIVCDDDAVPGDVQADRGWRALKLEGPFAFEMTGIAAALLSPLAAAGISCLLIATYDTDYLLVKDEVLDRAVDVLRAADYDAG
jgi:hypothetical protein